MYSTRLLPSWSRRLVLQVVAIQIRLGVWHVFNQTSTLLIKKTSLTGRSDSDSAWSVACIQQDYYPDHDDRFYRSRWIRLGLECGLCATRLLLPPAPPPPPRPAPPLDFSRWLSIASVWQTTASQTHHRAWVPCSRQESMQLPTSHTLSFAPLCENCRRNQCLLNF